jgi:hypothetical protein
VTQGLKVILVSKGHRVMPERKVTQGLKVILDRRAHKVMLVPKVTLVILGHKVTLGRRV